MPSQPPADTSDLAETPDDTLQRPRLDAASGWDSVHRLLLVRLDNIGDVVLLGPAVAALRRALPDAEITLLASPAGAQAAALLPEVDRVVEHRASWQQLQAGRVTPDEEITLARRLRSMRFDGAIVFTSFAQTPVAAAYLAYLAGIPRRAAYAGRFSGELITNVAVESIRHRHQAERNLHLVESLGFEVPDRALRLAIPPEAGAAADELLHTAGLTNGEPFVALAPGASAPARRYPAARFAEVARQVHNACGMRVLVLGSAQEQEAATGIVREAASPGVTSLAGRMSIPELAALVARSSLVVANNSLAMHLADGLGVPAVVTYSGTDPEEYWRPRRSPHLLLNRPTECSPCFGIECDRGLACLDVGAEEVTAAVRALLRPPLEAAGQAGG